MCIRMYVSTIIIGVSRPQCDFSSDSGPVKMQNRKKYELFTVLNDVTHWWSDQIDMLPNEPEPLKSQAIRIPLISFEDYMFRCSISRTMDGSCTLHYKDFSRILTRLIWSTYLQKWMNTSRDDVKHSISNEKSEIVLKGSICNRILAHDKNDNFLDYRQKTNFSPKI